MFLLCGYLKWYCRKQFVGGRRPKRCKSLEASHSSILVETTEVQRRDRSKANCPETGDIHYYSVRSIIEIPFDLEASLSLRPKIDKPWQAQANTSRSRRAPTPILPAVPVDRRVSTLTSSRSGNLYNRAGIAPTGKVYNIRPFLAGRVSILSKESGHAIVNNDTSSCLLIWLGVNRLFCRVLRSCTCDRRVFAVSY